MLKIYLCDDDPDCLVQIRQLIYTWADETGHPLFLQAFDNGDELLAHQKKDKADIIFLDIMMPLLSGMETARELRRSDRDAKIIFLTSSPEFAVESYDVKASGYLLKPVNRNKFFSVLNECAQIPETEPEHILVKTLGGYQKIYLQNIECMEAQSRKVIFYLSDGHSAEALGTFSGYAEELTLEQGFYKCHRSYMVNLPNIDHFNSAEIMTRCGIRIPIARGLARSFKEAYFAHMFRKDKED